MRFLVMSGRTFCNFPCVIYATNIAFQQCNRPVGNSGEKDSFYSGKHHLHGLKVKVSVNPRGFAINCTNFEKEASQTSKSSDTTSSFIKRCVSRQVKIYSSKIADQ